MKKQIRKKCLIWLMVLVSLLGILSLSVGTRQVIAATSVSEAVTQMKEAAQVQLVTNVFSKCVKMQRDKGDYPGGFTKIIPNIFNYDTGGLWKNKEVPTGAWLENQVQGKVNNGTIYCNDNDSNLINVFANTMGISVNDIVCNGEQPGILKAYINGEEIGGRCSSAIGAEGVRWYWNDETSATNYLKKLYDNKLNDNPYKTGWGDRGTFTNDLVNYYLYLSDFETACSTKKYDGDPKLMDKSRYFPALKIPDPTTGELKEVYYSNQSIKEDDWDSNWINSDGPHTCEAVIERMNKAAPAVQAKLNEITEADKKTAKDKCNGEAISARNKLKTELSETEDEAAKAALQARIDLIDELYKNGIASGGYDSDGNNNDRLWRTESDGSIVCRFDADDPHEIDGDNTPLYTPPEDNDEIGSGLDGVDGGDAKDDTPICSTAAGSLGWIMCTVIQGVGDSVSAVYDMIEEDFLQTNASFVARTIGDTKVKSPTYKTWETFQTFANIAFVIVLAVIILSQITGFGVSNYGIKKVLPSLIIVAMLVNLSYFICQIAVDVSNILGYELRAKFLEFANEIDIDPALGSGNTGAIVGYVVSTIMSGAALGGIGIVLFKNFKAWIWPFLVSLIGVAIGVLFFFLILGVRQAGIIVLIVLSPLAIICYALPNTKSLFDRWRKMLTSLLIVYPICGLLMGGGHFVGRLLLSNINSTGEGGNISSMLFFGTVDSGISNFFYVLIAMLIQVVPFFFIPSIVKSSMAALGNLGMKLSNFGRGISHGATGTIRRSDGYKNRVAMGREGIRARSASRRLKGMEKTTGLRGKANALGAKYRGSNLIGAKKAAEAYDHKKATSINAVAAYNAARLRDQMTAANGLDKAETNEDSAMREDYAKAYERDTGFMSDQTRWKSELDDALTAVEQNPTDRTAMSKLRGLQDVLSKTDKGQSIMQQVYNNRMRDEQDAARAAGRAAQVSDGMRLAAANLANDHGELKGKNRGFYEMLNDMADSNAGKVFSRGQDFKTQTYTDAGGRTIHESGNSYYDSVGAMKYDPRSIANAGESALQRLAAGVNSMTPDEAAAVYRSATEAISNDNIDIKPENEKYLNDIRRAAYAAMQSNFVSSYVNHGEYVDDKGRTYSYTGVDSHGDAQYQRDGTTKTYTFDGTNFMDNKSGKILAGSRFSQSATDMFKAKYGSYQDLHSGMKINH